MAAGIADLTGIRAKLRRAKEHQNTLKTEFSIWVEQHANTRRFQIRRDSSWYVVTGEPFPQLDIRFCIIAGDLVHNLRSALDHLVWQLVIRDGQEPSRRNEFPICYSQKRFRDDVKFRKNKPKLSVLYGIMVDGDAWTIIEKAQPYVSLLPEENLIGLIGRLSSLDKHRTLYVQMPMVGDIKDAISWSPEAILLEERIGVQALSFEHPTEVVRYRFADNPYPNVQVKGGLPISPTIGEGTEEGYQLDIPMFNNLIGAVTAIVDEVSKLPRVIDV